MASTTNDVPKGPAPARRMPTGLIQSENRVGYVANGQAMPTINLVPRTLTVTPLHLLSEGTQWIDCPFCQRRAGVIVRKVGTGMQALAAVLCCMFCVCLTCVPCLAHWYENIEYTCSNCNNLVAIRPHDGPMQTFSKRPDVVEVPTQYHDAPSPAHIR
ncbi:hypothetical protein CDD82_2430 [Ophiocordyceps australis]|uniref:LITAF domain-containing protein n=1 Tax=Ophiocordyceps australis TaxID=1399860 RepID=A0A2C5ZJH4_9HYPO|nr:hypothetical protein CDD82_2430 [Ophiocordyceps australis]